AMTGCRPNQRRLAIRTSTTDGDVVEVAVCDTGPGFPAENQDRIFDPFFTTKSSGLGMGLAISRSIVESHGGRLWAAPGDGVGTIFQFTLPRAKEARSDEP
ncbi:MAG: hypothetical protein FJX47_06290, partial [Alphaproteobacteria bacterium]|nr:hypothetical protein [Alphaproteobacteria bacterium]